MWYLQALLGECGNVTLWHEKTILNKISASAVDTASTHSLSKLLGILQCKERTSVLSLLLFFSENYLWQYLWNFRKLIPDESLPGHSTVNISTTLTLKLSWFNLKAAFPWGPLNSGASDVSLRSGRAWIIFNLLAMLQRSIYSLTEMVRAGEKGVDCCWLVNIVISEKNKLFGATSSIFLHCSLHFGENKVWTGPGTQTALDPCSRQPAHVFGSVHYELYKPPQLCRGAVY